MIAFHTINKLNKTPRRITTKNSKAYKSYLLRLWREESSSRLLLRLQAVEQDARVLSFADLESFIVYLESVLVDLTGGFSAMVTLFLRQSVQDYDHWKSFYSEVSALRQRAGVTEARVYRGSHDPNQVTIMLQFSDLDEATAYATSEELKAAMMKAGVVSKPEIWFATDVEHTAF